MKDGINLLSFLEKKVIWKKETFRTTLERKNEKNFRKTQKAHLILYPLFSGSI